MDYFLQDIVGSFRLAWYFDVIVSFAFAKSVQNNIRFKHSVLLKLRLFVKFPGILRRDCVFWRCVPYWKSNICQYCMYS